MVWVPLLCDACVCVTMVVAARVTEFPVIGRAASMSCLATTMRMNAKKLKPCMTQNRYWDKSGKQ